MAGRVEAIWIKRAVRGVMEPAEQATLVAGRGIAGDANAGRAKRQVTIVEQEVFERIRRTLPGAEPIMRRANIMVSGVRLAHTREHIVTLGDVRVLIKGETRPCERMDEQCPGLARALEDGWGGGVYGIVLDDGSVRVGDAVAVWSLDVRERAG
jgi:MOSC domain-containing protein YiiM